MQPEEWLTELNRDLHAAMEDTTLGTFEKNHLIEDIQKSIRFLKEELSETNH